MSRRWEDLGNNRWKLTITADDPEDASQPSVYRGTKEEIADMLAESQSNANRRIAELKRGPNGHAAPPAAPKPLSPSERMQTVADLQNPATVDKGVTRVIESVMGPIEEERERRHRQDLADHEREAVQAATAFAEDTPEWFPSEHNKNTLVRFMRSQGLNPTNRAHYIQAFDELSAAQLLQPRPSEEEPELEPEATAVERNAPAPPKPKAPSRVSTGITRADISGTPPKPTTRLKYTREQLANLSSADYKRLVLTDRAELERCENFYSAQDQERARRKALAG